MMHVGAAKRTGHPAECYCGKPATCHVSYGSGCGNVCAKHARSIAKIKGGAATITQLTEKESAR